MGFFPNSPNSSFSGNLAVGGALTAASVAATGAVTGASMSATGTISAGGTPIMQKQAATAVGGYALVNGTGTVITWTTPNDGLLHRALIVSTMHVATTMTGGATQYAYTNPGGFADADQLYAANLTASNYPQIVVVELAVEANTAVSVTQSSALTVGAATLWTEIWGS